MSLALIKKHNFNIAKIEDELKQYILSSTILKIIKVNNLIDINNFKKMYEGFKNIFF